MFEVLGVKLKFKNKSITVPSCNASKNKLLYGNGLKTNGAQIVEENGKKVLIINLNGEQKKYTGEALKGSVIDIYANTKINKLATNSNEDITLEYKNENATIYTDKGQEKSGIDIVSENSMILTNDAKVSGVTTFGKDENKEVPLEVNKESKTEKINMNIINNEGTDISNVAILGKIPSEGNLIKLKNKININKNAKVYYTDAENPTVDLNNRDNKWNNQFNKNAKYYLIQLDSLAKDESVGVNYNVDIAENLNYNITTAAGYTVTYENTNTGVNSEAKSSELQFTTGSTAIITEELIATKGNVTLNNKDEVKAGEIIEYTVKLTNSGNEDAQNVTLTGTVPEGTALIEVNSKYWDEEVSEEMAEEAVEKVIDETGDANANIEESTSIIEEAPIEINEGNSKQEEYYIEKEEREIKRENIAIKAGETIQLKYMVRVKSDISDKTEGTAKVTMQYKDQNETKEITHILRNSKLAVTLMQANRSKNEKLVREIVVKPIVEPIVMSEYLSTACITISGSS